MTSNGEELVKENGLHDSKPYDSDTDDELLQMVIELKFQTEYFKSHFDDLKDLHKDIKQDDNKENELNAKIDSLNRELLEEKQTRDAAEQALKHLRAEYSEADAKAQALAEAQQKMDQEIKERDEKYTELDSKFNRLHKRAKQRIQEVQKEKEDIEAQFRELNEKAEKATSQLSTLQQELDRTRQQASDALKAIDVDRQQLRTANIKLRDNIEELRRSLEPKENEIEQLQQSLLEKEQLLEDMKGQLQTLDDKKQASVVELSSKHQKQIESLEGQLSDTLSERNKAAETVSTLQKLLAEKESKIAEMDAASSGEAARFRASMEAIKGETTHLKDEHEKEKKIWEASTLALNKKLEIAESNCIRTEIEAAKMRSRLELEISLKTQTLNTRDTELVTAKEEIKRLESEFNSYKVRAHSLLQRKDTELAAAKDNEQLKAHEEALKEAENEILLASAERDKALQDLQDVLANHDKELAEKDEALGTAEERIKNIEMKFSSAVSRYQSDKETWERNLQNVEETWRLRCEALKAEKEASPDENLQKELNDLKLRYKKLKEEHDSFRDLADKMMEEKEKEISKLSDDNKNLHQSLAHRPKISENNAGYQRQNSPSTSSAEQQILILARQQAQREEELAQSQRHILALQEEIEELEHENRLHSQQEAVLKEEVRKMERMQKREGVDMTYLKNVIVKLLETGEVEALLPVVAMLLQFSPDEMQKCQRAYRASADVQAATPATESSGSGTSLFSRFTFS